MSPTISIPVQCNLDYPTPQLSERKISQATPTFTKAMCVVVIAKSCNMAFSNRQSNMEHRKCIDYRREAESTQSTIVAKS